MNASVKVVAGPVNKEVGAVLRLFSRRSIAAAIAGAAVILSCGVGGSAIAAPATSGKINLWQYQLNKKASNGKSLCLTAPQTSGALTIEYCNSADARQLWFYTEYNGFGVQANYNWSTYPSTLWGSKTPDLNTGSKVGLSRPNGTSTHDWTYNSSGQSPLIYNRSNHQVVFEVKSFTAGSNVYLARAASGGDPNVSWTENNTGTFTP